MPGNHAGLFYYIYSKINIMEKRIIDFPTSKQQEEIDWAAQAIANNRAGLRLEAMKIAASQKQYANTRHESLEAEAERIFQWITKPE